MSECNTHISRHGGFAHIRAGSQGENWGDYSHVTGISGETTGATGLSMDIQTIPPGAEAAPHVHDGFEAGLYILSGEIIHCYGPDMGQEFAAGPGDFIYVAPDFPHMSMNLSENEPVVLVVARTTASGFSDNVMVE